MGVCQAHCRCALRRFRRVALLPSPRLERGGVSLVVALYIDPRLSYHSNNANDEERSYREEVHHDQGTAGLRQVDLG